MKSPETIIVRELLLQEGGYVSGTSLAQKLGMSRVAVWQHMEKLREQGFEFEATRSRGYRLVRQPESLNETLLRAYLPVRERGVTLTVLPQTDSTNDAAARELSSGREVPFVIMARQQTGGRGRFGRRWVSEVDGNLYASFAFRPQVEPARMQTFTLWMGVNVCDVIANFYRVTPGIKWPNDLLFGEKKFGGMLTEARIDADQMRDLVFGLGLNLRTPSGGWPGELAGKATALDQHARESFSTNKLAAALIGRVLIAYDRFIADEYMPALAELWNRYDVLRGKSIAVQQGARSLSGIAAGIDDEGSLILRNERGGTERFRAGEVSLSPSYAAAR